MFKKNDVVELTEDYRESDSQYDRTFHKGEICHIYTDGAHPNLTAVKFLDTGIRFLPRKLLRKVDPLLDEEIAETELQSYVSDALSLYGLQLGSRIQNGRKSITVSKITEVRSFQVFDNWPEFLEWLFAYLASKGQPHE